MWQELMNAEPGVKKKSLRLIAQPDLKRQTEIRKKLQHTAGIRDMEFTGQLEIVEVVYDADLITWKDIAKIMAEK